MSDYPRTLHLCALSNKADLEKTMSLCSGCLKIFQLLLDLEADLIKIKKLLGTCV